MTTDSLPENFLVQRAAMVQDQLRARALRDERVLAAMLRVPRHEFVAQSLRRHAYEDHPLPIGDNQTISQPYIVGLTLEALALRPADIVLEVGTGSGYQTALLAELTRQVYSIERYADLAREAEARLARLGYSNMSILIADGSLGLPEHAPFDAIVVSAAALSIPSALFEQLREGGRMIIPVGEPHAQELQLVRKQNGHPYIVSLGGCAFVPLVSGETA